MPYPTLGKTLIDFSHFYREHPYFKIKASSNFVISIHGMTFEIDDANTLLSYSSQLSVLIKVYGSGFSLFLK